jgi:2-polyprenyl-3-methyl-5-hydroxy-6-metoxy-1,4-benzoquinol methylase
MTPVPNASQNHFDTVASRWAGWYETRESFIARLDAVSEAMARMLPTDASARVLDFGGGPGVFSAFASGMARHVICLDTSSAMASAGRDSEATLRSLVKSRGLEYRPARVSRIVGTLDTIAAPARFDLVLAIAVLEYLVDLGAVIDRLVTLVRPGGALLLTVPDTRSLVRRAERPIDHVAALAGTTLHVDRLAQRAYSATRPHGSRPPWERALAGTRACLVAITPIPLGSSGVRRWFKPNRLVVARVPRAGS